MDLYILRHGIAEDRRPTLPESQRRLTREGASKTRDIGKGIKELGLKFDLILSSPYYRAKETAEIVAECLRRAKALKLTSTLAPDGNPRELIEELTGTHSRCKSVLLVGHEPYLSSLISLLVSGHTDLRITLKKGGLGGLSVEKLHYGRCATLEFLMTSGQIRAMR